MDLFVGIVSEDSGKEALVRAALCIFAVLIKNTLARFAPGFCFIVNEIAAD